MEAKGALAWKPNRDRTVSLALQAYAALTTSASRGAVRDLSQLATPPKRQASPPPWPKPHRTTPRARVGNRPGAGNE